MSAVTLAVRDSATMFRRDLRRSLRYPAMTISGIIVPVLFLLLFGGVFGRTLHAGLAAVTPHAGSYINYLAPGILLMTAAAAAEATALNVLTDMTEGIITRFRTMAVARGAVLGGQVLGSLLRTLVSGAFVVVVAFGLGLPAGRLRARVGGDRRCVRHGQPGPHLGGRCLRVARQDPVGREQPGAHPGGAAVRQQRLRCPLAPCPRGAVGSLPTSRSPP